MNRRGIYALLCVLTLLVAPVLADEGEETAVIGEILDLACYISHDAQGSEHAKCAERCVKGGQPMGLKAEDGTVYVLFADHSDADAFEKAKEFAGKNVEISGLIADKNGIKGITVHSVKAL